MGWGLLRGLWRRETRLGMRRVRRRLWYGMVRLLGVRLLQSRDLWKVLLHGHGKLWRLHVKRLLLRRVHKCFAHLRVLLLQLRERRHMAVGVGVRMGMRVGVLRVGVTRVRRVGRRRRWRWWWRRRRRTRMSRLRVGEGVEGKRVGGRQDRAREGDGRLRHVRRRRLRSLGGLRWRVARGGPRARLRPIVAHGGGGSGRCGRMFRTRGRRARGLGGS